MWDPESNVMCIKDLSDVLNAYLVALFQRKKMDYWFLYWIDVVSIFLKKQR